MNDQTQSPPKLLPATWLGRVLAIFIAAGLAVIGLFFLAFALIAAAIIAVIVIARIWWVSRKLRAQRDSGVIEGTYSIESESVETVQRESTGGTLPPPQK